MSLLEWALSLLSGIKPPDPSIKREKADCLKALHDGVVDGSLDAASVCMGIERLIDGKGTNGLKEGAK